MEFKSVFVVRVVSRSRIGDSLLLSTVLNPDGDRQK